MILRRALVAAAALAVAATGTARSADNAAGEDGKRRIVCSTTQVADFARQIVGDRCEVICILGEGVNPHVYQPVPGDSRLVESADLCIENGLHLEGKNWMGTLARDNGNKPLVTATRGVRPLDLEYEGQVIKDPHAWFDPRNAAVYVNNILAAVVEMDPTGEPGYRSRAELYLQVLRALDAWIEKQVAALHHVPRRTMSSTRRIPKPERAARCLPRKRHLPNGQLYPILRRTVDARGSRISKRSHHAMSH